MLDYGMYTTAGNKRIETILGRLAGKLSCKLSIGEVATKIEKTIKAYTEMGKYPSYSEAYDTAVRELVYDGIKDIVMKSGYPVEIVNVVWYSTY